MEGIRNVRPVESTQAYNQYEPVFDRSFGRAYPSRPDTIASMAKTGAKRLLIITVVFGLLYALYAFIASRFSVGPQPPSTPDIDREERDVPQEKFNQKELNSIRPTKTTFNDAADVSESTVVIPKDNPPVIYDPSHANKANAEILASYQKVTSVANQATRFNILSILLGNLMTNMGSSEDFKALIQKEKNEQAVSQLIDFIIDTYGRHISSYNRMPSFAHNKKEVKAKIIAIMRQ